MAGELIHIANVVGASSLPANAVSIVSVIAAFASLWVAFRALRVNSLNLHAKLHDRLYELDKLIASNAEAYVLLFNATSLNNIGTLASKHFTPSGALQDRNQALAAKVIALGYFYLNMFEEMYTMYVGDGVEPSANTEWQAWKSYIFEQLTVPVIRELAFEELGSPNDGSGARFANQTQRVSVYGQKFRKYLVEHQSEWADKPKTVPPRCIALAQ